MFHSCVYYLLSETRKRYNKNQQVFTVKHEVLKFKLTKPTWANVLEGKVLGSIRHLASFKPISFLTIKKNGVDFNILIFIVQGQYLTT